MMSRFRSADAFIQSERGLKAAGVLGVILLVTSIASIGANKQRETAGALGAPEGPSAQTKDSGLIESPVPSGSATQASMNGGSRASAGASGPSIREVPP